MASKVLNKTDKFILGFIVFLLLSYLFLKANQLILRKPYRILSVLLLSCLLLYLVLKIIDKIFIKRKGLLRFLAWMLFGVSLFLLILNESDKETVVDYHGEKKVCKESSFIMFYEVTYYDYDNFLCYKAYPCIRESYDDGDPEQLVYIDYYDENGILSDREFCDE